MLYKKRWIAAAVIGSMLVTACSSQGSDSADSLRDVKKVQVTQVKREPSVRTFELSGTLEPSEEATVSFEVPGRLVELGRSEGDKVKAGEVLARVDTSDLSLQLARANAGVEQAGASLAEVTNGAREQEIAQAKAALDKATVAYNQAKSDYERFEVLYQQDAISQNDYENMKNRLVLAEKDLQTAEQAYSLVTQGARQEVREQTRSAYDLAVIAKEQAALSLDKTRLKAPIEGTVIAKYSSVGELINAGTPIYKIGNIDALKVVLPVPDKEIAAWRTGDSVTLELYGEKREGTVSKIYPATNQSTGTIGVEVSVPNPQHDWYAGQVVVAHRKLAGSPSIFVPVEAVISRGEEKPFVFLAVDGKAVKTHVTIGELHDNKLEISSGLQEGDSLIVKGVDRLFDGDPVESAGGSQP
ncbi:efflux RND transporter periplasmic adaptor subunit [Brevibacillus massiliensis]|jgi:multidrug efflux pump subunit AcrA (membrane-fusion protein)|uniref:efflux RND transporter periplasmic adaptor subunit n=1 Tax=Brevibacillus massiliensis TaxID=1118054 RepID=UPI00030CB30E|nr:efflux RND transporter periplasmic adaptor subunit [Brevibacillus massiliensis]